MAQAERLDLRVVPFADWRREIAPLWRLEGAVGWIPRLLGGHGQLRYVGGELAERVLLFPVAAELDGRRVGWTSSYNVSDEAIRLRGIYVLPEFRAMGIGRRLAAFACALWPAPWRTCLIYARATNVAIYERWGFAAAPGHAPRSTELDRVLPGITVLLMSRPIDRGAGGAAADRAPASRRPDDEIDAAYPAALATASRFAEMADTAYPPGGVTEDPIDTGYATALRAATRRAAARLDARRTGGPITEFEGILTA